MNVDGTVAPAGPVVAEVKDDVKQPITPAVEVQQKVEEPIKEEVIDIKELLKDVGSLDDLLNNEKIKQILEERAKTATSEQTVEKEKHLAKIKELMDELKPLKAKFKSEEHLKLFNDGDVEGLTKKIESDNALIYQEIITQEKSKYTRDVEALTNEKTALTEQNEKLKDVVKTIQLEKFFSGKDIDPAAIKDAISFAKNDFDIDEEINFKHKKVNEYTIDNFLEKQRTERPYLFNKFNKVGVSKSRIVKPAPVSVNDMSIDAYAAKRAKEDGLT